MRARSAAVAAIVIIVSACTGGDSTRLDDDASPAPATRVSSTTGTGTTSPGTTTSSGAANAARPSSGTSASTTLATLSDEDFDSMVSMLSCSTVGPNILYDELDLNERARGFSDEVISALLSIEDSCTEAARLETDTFISSSAAQLAEAARTLADCGAAEVGECRVAAIDFDDSVHRLNRFLNGDTSVAPPSAKPPHNPDVGYGSLPGTADQPDPELGTPEAGVVLAQQLIDALVAGDWPTARAINPRIPFTDDELENGYVDLADATLFLGGSESIADNHVALYLLQVAHEERPEGPRTSHYCVRWDYRVDEQTIEQVSGELVLQEEGFAPPQDARRGAGICDQSDHAQDLEDLLDTVTEQTQTPGPTRNPEPTQDELPVGWVQINVDGSDHICSPSFSGWGDFDCQRFRGYVPFSIVVPELRCSESLGSYECTSENYYPSELDGYEVAQIGFERVLCDWRDHCWIWPDHESPSITTLGLHDYECGFSGCTKR